MNPATQEQHQYPSQYIYFTSIFTIHSDLHYPLKLLILIEWNRTVE